MSTDTTWQTDTTSSEETEKIGERLGQRLRGGEVIELSSDLGGGKTTFTRGLARGIGSKDHVSSPTFTISKVYQGDKLTIHHFDFYRLSEAGLITHELADVLGDPNIVIVVEWANIVEHVLPEKRLSIHIKTTSDDERKLTYNYPNQLEYLVST